MAKTSKNTEVSKDDVLSLFKSAPEDNVGFDFDFDFEETTGGESVEGSGVERMPEDESETASSEVFEFTENLEEEERGEGWRQFPDLRRAINAVAQEAGSELPYSEDEVLFSEESYQAPIIRLPEQRIEAGADYETEPFLTRDLPTAPPAVSAASPAAERSAMENNARMRRTTAGDFDVTSEMIDRDPRQIVQERGIDLVGTGAPIIRMPETQIVAGADYESEEQPLVRLPEQRIEPGVVYMPETEIVAGADYESEEKPFPQAKDAIPYSPYEPVGLESPAASNEPPSQAPASSDGAIATATGTSSALAKNVAAQTPAETLEEAVSEDSPLPDARRNQLRQDVARLEKLKQQRDEGDDSSSVGADILEIFRRILVGIAAARAASLGIPFQDRVAEERRQQQQQEARQAQRDDRMRLEEGRNWRFTQGLESQRERDRMQAETQRARQDATDAYRNARLTLDQQRAAAAQQAAEAAQANAELLTPLRAELIRAQTGQANRANQGPRAGGGRRGRGAGARGRGAAVPLDATAAGVLSALDAITPETSEADFNSAISAAARMAENRRLPASVRSDLIEGVRRAQRARGAAGQEGPEILPGVHRSVGEGGAPRVELADREIRDARDALADYRELSQAIQRMGSIAQRARRIIEEQGLNGWRSDAMMALRQEQSANLEAFERLFQRSMGALTEADVRRLFGRVPIPVPNALDYAGMALSEGNLFNPIELAERGIAAQRGRLADTVRTTADRYGLVADEAIGYVTGRRRANRRSRRGAGRQRGESLRAQIRQMVRELRAGGRSNDEIRSLLEGQEFPARLISGALQ